MSTIGALAGLAFGYVLYHERKATDPLESKMGPLWNVFQQRYYIDAFYMRWIIYPVRDTWSKGVYWFNQNVLDAVVNGAAMASRGLSVVVMWFDRNVIDGIVNGSGRTASRSGRHTEVRTDRQRPVVRRRVVRRCPGPDHRVHQDRVRGSVKSR